MIFVTGGTGLVGTHLLYELTRQDLPIRALKRATASLDEVYRVFRYYSDDADRLVDRIEWVDGDLKDAFALERHLDGITDIYHTAALVSFDPPQRRSMMKINVDGTASLINMALKKRISRFCFVSSVAAIGPQIGKKARDESSIWKKSKYTHFYSWTKFKSEMEVWRGWAEGLNTVIVNPSIILGPGNWHRGAGQIFRTIDRGLAFYPSGVTGYVDVRDVVSIMLQLMDRELYGERFILNSENLKFHELFQMIAHTLGRKPPAIRSRRWMMSLAWRIEWLKSKLTGMAPLITRESARASVNVSYFSNEKICNTLGYRFRPVEESIREIGSYYLNDFRKPGRE